jgi:hypothetical protein
MVSDGRYVSDEVTFKRYAYTALGSHFANRAAFDEFYASLESPTIKDEFLRVAAFYLFLVKCGDWHVTVDGSAPVVDYLTNSFKVTALFALIESLSDTDNQDLYRWLSTKNATSVFPIADAAALSALNEEYKDTYGSIRRCVAFFSRLKPDRQQMLCAAIKVDDRPLGSVKKVAEFLYELRSKFVHEARLVLTLGGATALSTRGKKVVETDLSVETLLEVFEEGLLAHFVG